MDKTSFWQYLSTRVLTGEGDKILCVGTSLPETVIGELTMVTSLEEAEGSYHLIVGEKILNRTYKQAEHFERVR